MPFSRDLNEAYRGFWKARSHLLQEYRRLHRKEKEDQRAAFAMDPTGLAGQEALARLQRKIAKVSIGEPSPVNRSVAAPGRRRR